MKIGIDARMIGNRHGGIGRYVLELAKNLLEIDRENQYVFFFNRDGEADIESLRKITARFGTASAQFVPVNIRHYSVAEQLRLPKILDKYNLDLVHFPNFNVPLLYKKPFIVTIHDMVHHKISGHKKSHYLHFQAYKKIIESAASRARAIITVSEYSKRDIAKILDQRQTKIEVIYEGTTLDPVVTDSAVADVKRQYLLKRPYFLFVGVLERKKNVVNLTRGFDVFMKQFGLDMDMVIVGRADPHYPDIKHHALDIQANNRLVFTGYVDDQDLAALYKGAYAFASASLHEGFGLPGVEAMRFGLPLAVSNIEVFNEIYDNAAVYFDPLKPDDIASKLALLARDTSFYQQIQKNSINRGLLFDWKKTAVQTLEIYKQTTVEISKQTII